MKKLMALMSVLVLCVTGTMAQTTETTSSNQKVAELSDVVKALGIPLSSTPPCQNYEIDISSMISESKTTKEPAYRALPIQSANLISEADIRRKLGNPVRVTTALLSGGFFTSDGREIKVSGTYLWYGHVGLGVNNGKLMALAYVSEEIKSGKELKDTVVNIQPMDTAQTETKQMPQTTVAQTERPRVEAETNNIVVDKVEVETDFRQLISDRDPPYSPPVIRPASKENHFVFVYVTAEFPKAKSWTLSDFSLQDEKKREYHVMAFDIGDVLNHFLIYTFESGALAIADAKRKIANRLQDMSGTIKQEAGKVCFLGEWPGGAGKLVLGFEVPISVIKLTLLRKSGGPVTLASSPDKEPRKKTLPAFKHELQESNSKPDFDVTRTLNTGGTQENKATLTGRTQQIKTNENQPEAVPREMLPKEMNITVGCLNKAGKLCVVPDDKMKAIRKALAEFDLSTQEGRMALVKSFKETFGDEAEWRGIIFRAKDGNVYSWPPSKQINSASQTPNEEPRDKLSQEKSSKFPSESKLSEEEKSVSSPTTFSGAVNGDSQSIADVHSSEAGIHVNILGPEEGKTADLCIIEIVNGDPHGQTNEWVLLYSVFTHDAPPILRDLDLKLLTLKFSGTQLGCFAANGKTGGIYGSRVFRGKFPHRVVVSLTEGSSASGLLSVRTQLWKWDAARWMPETTVVEKTIDVGERKGAESTFKSPFNRLPTGKLF